MPEQEIPPCACTDGLAVRCEFCIQNRVLRRCDQSQQNHVSRGRSGDILIQPSNLEDRDCAINLVYYIYHPRTCATEYTLRINKDPSIRKQSWLVQITGHLSTILFFASRCLCSQISTSVPLIEATKDTAGDKIATEPSRQNETLKKQNKIRSH